MKKLRTNSVVNHFIDISGILSHHLKNRERASEIQNWPQPHDKSFTEIY